MRDISTKVNDTAPASTGLLDAGEFNSTQTELENAVTSIGLSLDGASGPDTNQRMMAQALARYAAGGAIWVTDTGAANAHVVSRSGSFDNPSALFTGLTVRFDPAANNTGATTLNAFGLGVKPLVDHVSGPLTSGAIDGRVIDCVYDASIGSGSWVLPAWSNALYVGATPSSPPAVSAGEGWTVNGSNQGDLNFPGLTGDSSPQNPDVFAFYDDADTEHKGITWAQLLVAIAAANAVPQVAPELALTQQRTSTAAALLPNGAWTTRILNNVNTNNITSSSVNTGTGAITLPAGTYRIDARCAAYLAGGNKLRVYNETDATTILTGPNSDSNNTTGNAVTIVNSVMGRFTLAGTKVIKIQHWGGSDSGARQGDDTHSGTVIDAQVLIEQLSA